MKRIVFLSVLILALLCGSVFTGYHMFTGLQEYREGEKAYDALSQYVQTTEPENTEPTDIPATESQEIDSIWPSVDFESLESINEDFVAWICLEDTVINYPVVQGDDNDYYVYRLFDGTENKSGTIFMDYRNQPDFTDRNTVLHGHHMKDGSMFQLITHYKMQSFYDEHPYFLIMTPDGNYKLELFAGYVASLNEQCWRTDFDSDEEFLKWVDKAVSRSKFKSDVIPTAEDRVVTLSTCDYDFEDARFVLLGVLRDPSVDYVADDVS